MSIKKIGLTGIVLASLMSCTAPKIDKTIQERMDFSNHIFSNITTDTKFIRYSNNISLVDLTNDGKIDAYITFNSGRAGAGYQAFKYEN